MKTLNTRIDAGFELKSVRELTLDEVKQISGGVAEADGMPHGRGCPCMTCRVKNSGNGGPGGGSIID